MDKRIREINLQEKLKRCCRGEEIFIETGRGRERVCFNFLWFSSYYEITTIRDNGDNSMEKITYNFPIHCKGQIHQKTKKIQKRDNEYPEIKYFYEKGEEIAIV